MSPTYKVRIDYNDGAQAVGYHITRERARSMAERAERELGKTRDDREGCSITSDLFPYLAGLYVAREPDGTFSSGSEL